MNVFQKNMLLHAIVCGAALVFSIVLVYALSLHVCVVNFFFIRFMHDAYFDRRYIEIDILNARNI